MAVIKEQNGSEKKERNEENEKEDCCDNEIKLSRGKEKRSMAA